MPKAPRTTLATLAILRVMLKDPTERFWGAQIADELPKLKSGVLYPALARLERAGWLDSKWETKSPSELKRPRRKYYQLTGVGQLAARQALAEHMDLLAPDEKRREPAIRSKERLA
jgi:PadR family transcriptional regulator, regulatory protein PadR